MVLSFLVLQCLNFRANLHPIEFEDAATIYKNLTDGSNRAFITEQYYLMNISKHEASKFAVLKEKIITDSFGISFPINCFLFKTYKDNIDRMFEAGIIDMLWTKFIEKQIKHLTYNNTNNNEDPKALTIVQLHIWFIFWLALMTFAATVFLAELLMMKIARIVARKGVVVLIELWQSMVDLD
jgi:hypothetical protein